MKPQEDRIIPKDSPIGPHMCIHISIIRAGLLGADLRVMSYGYFLIFLLIKLLYYVLKTCHIKFVQLNYWNCMGDGGPLAS